MNGHDSAQTEDSTWTYPTRQCRLCFEDVVPTVTMHPPGLPTSLQRPVVEYKNDDEYGRLIKPCHCRGGMRYVHELCLRRQRTQGVRDDSSWKCPTCGQRFNFQRLKVQKLLASRGSVVILTFVMLFMMMFLLGFVADPAINIYIDPYDTLATNESWHSVEEAYEAAQGKWSYWKIHFLKGFISVGLIGLLKTLTLSPWGLWNWRNAGMMGGRRRASNAGREDAVNIGLVMVAIGVVAALWLFYQWCQSLVAYVLRKIGESVVDTHLAGDDDDIRPPPGWKPPSTTPEQPPEETVNDDCQPTSSKGTAGHFSTFSLADVAEREERTTDEHETLPDLDTAHAQQDLNVTAVQENPDLAAIYRQSWSFGSI